MQYCRLFPYLPFHGADLLLLFPLLDGFPQLGGVEGVLRARGAVHGVGPLLLLQLGRACGPLALQVVDALALLDSGVEHALQPFHLGARSRRFRRVAGGGVLVAVRLRYQTELDVVTVAVAVVVAVVRYWSSSSSLLARASFLLRRCGRDCWSACRLLSNSSLLLRTPILLLLLGRYITVR